MKLLREFKIPERHYGSDVRLLIGDLKKAYSLLGRRHKDFGITAGWSNSGWTDRCETPDGRPIYYIWLDCFNPTDTEDHATLTHELYHLTHWIMRDIGLKYSEGSEEAFAYLQESLCDQFLKKLH